MPNFRKSNMFTRQAKIEEQVFGVNNDSEMGFLRFCKSTVFTRQQLEAIEDFYTFDKHRGNDAVYTSFYRNDAHDVEVFCKSTVFT